MTFQISGAMIFSLSVKFSWKDLYCEFNDRRQGLEMCVLHLVIILMYTDEFELSVTEG